jgi:mannose-6-phosphate isomerase-like protein (cupin superfamily)
MRFCLAILLLAAWPGRGEIRDLVKSAELDAMLARTEQSADVLVKPNYAVVLRVNSGKPGPWQAHPEGDELWFVRRGAAKLSLGALTLAVGVTPAADKHYEIGAGDVVNVPRNVAYQITPGAARFEYMAIRVFPKESHSRATAAPPAQPMPDVVSKSQIEDTFAKAEKNQPLHSLGALYVNYVIYNGAPGPWEAHRAADQVYVVRLGSARGQLDGYIVNPTEETPGEIRGTGMTGAREFTINAGDILSVPRNTAHYMVPTNGKFGYLLVTVRD